jgi:hypothetical protein
VTVVDHRHDVGVLDPAQALGLAIEARRGLAVADDVGGSTLTTTASLLIDRRAR